VTVKTLLSVFSAKVLAFAFRADVFGAIAFIFVAFDLLVFWIHAHDSDSPQITNRIIFFPESRCSDLFKGTLVGAMGIYFPANALSNELKTAPVHP